MTDHRSASDQMGSRASRHRANSTDPEQDLTIYHRLTSVPFPPDKWPIVYSPDYNISFFGMERVHPFDSCKWGNVFRMLCEDHLLDDQSSVLQPLAVTDDELAIVHTREYIESLRWSAKVAMVMEVPFIACAPNCVVQSRVLSPMRLQTGGTVLATHLALSRGWALNIGGGFHHCSGARGGGGFCPFADITLAIRYAFQSHSDRVRRAMVVDLDAHQGNGHEHDFGQEKERVFILDMYNASIYPNDRTAKAGISRRVELEPGTGDARYLELLRQVHVLCTAQRSAYFLVIFSLSANENILINTIFVDTYNLSNGQMMILR